MIIYAFTHEILDSQNIFLANIFQYVLQNKFVTGHTGPAKQSAKHMYKTFIAEEKKEKKGIKSVAD